MAKGLAICAEPYGCTLMAFDVRTGTTAWSMELGAAMFPHWPSPAIASDTLYIPRHDGALYAVDLARRKLAWRLYLGDHRLIGPDLPAGVLPEDAQCAWDPAIGRPLYASPAIGPDGTLYVGSGEGYLYAIGESTERAGLRPAGHAVSRLRPARAASTSSMAPGRSASVASIFNSPARR